MGGANFAGVLWASFLHKATFNGRLTSTGGRYFTKSHHIEISRRQLEQFGADDVEKIIKHELCHYHLHILGRGYQHRDEEFKTLLQEVGERDFAAPYLRLSVRSLIAINWFVQAVGLNIYVKESWIRRNMLAEIAAGN